MHEGVEDIGVFRSGGFRAKKEAYTILWQEFFLCQVCYMCVFPFCFPQDNYFFSEIWFILKKTLGILREHH